MDAVSHVSFDNNFLPTNKKLKINPKNQIRGTANNMETSSVSSSKSDALQYVMDLKKRISEKSSSKQSTSSSKEGHRNMAYDYDFVAAEV